MTGIVLGVVFAFFIVGWFAKLIAYFLHVPIAITLDLLSLIVKKQPVPIVPNANSSRGLCPICGHGSLVFRFETISGERDMRYKINPVCCLNCHWKGSLAQAYAAAQVVKAQMARFTLDNNSTSVALSSKHNKGDEVETSALAGISNLTPVIPGADSRRGLCPKCGHGSLRYVHETIPGSPDLRYKHNNLWCLKCNWRGAHIEAWEAAKSVEKQLFSLNEPIP